MSNEDKASNISKERSNTVDNTEAKPNYNIMKIFYSFSLKEKISSVRININKNLDYIRNNSILSAEFKNQIITKIKEPLYKTSAYCQEHYPYLSQISKNHDYLIVSTFTIIGALASMKYLPRKYFLMNTVLSYVHAKGVTSTINFVWLFPKEE